MTSPRNAQLAAAFLRTQRDALPATPPHREVRAQAILALQEELAKRARARKRARWVFGAVAAAAAVAITGGGMLALHMHHASSLAASAPSTPKPAATVAVIAHPTGDVTVVGGDGKPEALTDGSLLRAGSHVVARSHGRVVLSFATGTQLTAEDGGDVTVMENGSVQRLLLASGSLQAKVHKLGPHQRFLVSTPDAEVEVRGTQFRVSVVGADPSCGGGTRTRVVVTEGVVSVRSHGEEARVPAGSSWPPGCVARTAVGSTATAPTELAESTSPRPKAVPRPGNAASQASRSTLTEENDLFGKAVAARQRGDAPGAVAAWSTFIAKYPSSPLAESAAVERMKTLRGVDRARASAAARQYLDEYPSGFARAEAQAILAEDR